MIKKPAFGGKTRGAANGQTKTLPAPTGGWNTRDNEANMPIKKASIMENWLPLAANVALRPGYISHATGFPTPPRSLFAYTSPTASKLFAACDSGIFDCTAAAVVGAAAVSLTNGYLSSTMFTNVAGSFLITVNGRDDMKRFNGSTWSSITTDITGVATASLNFVHVFKRKLWFVQKDSMSAWYLPTNSIQGAATEFPVGQIFGKGGHLAALGSWTIDGGQGVDDHLVFVSSRGELAVYKGTDPSTAADFEHVGTYYLGEPLGQRCLATYGGDLLYLSQNGLFPLSKALLSTSINYRSALSDEISPTFAEQSSLYRDHEGWEIFIYPRGSVLLVNIPVSEGQRYDQFVMNTVNQAWCSFTNINPTCWANLSESAYFASGTAVYKGFTGTSDNGAVITGIVKQAYTYLNSSAQQKHVKMLRPVLKTDLGVGLSLGISTDFGTDLEFSQAIVPATSTATWDTAVWDTNTWGADLLTQKNWYTVAAREGYCAAVLLRAESNNAKVIWNATDVLFERGGVL